MSVRCAHTRCSPFSLSHMCVCRTESAGRALSDALAAVPLATEASVSTASVTDDSEMPRKKRRALLRTTSFMLEFEMCSAQLALIRLQLIPTLGTDLAFSLRMHDMGVMEVR